MGVWLFQGEILGNLQFYLGRKLFALGYAFNSILSLSWFENLINSIEIWNETQTKTVSKSKQIFGIDQTLNWICLKKQQYLHWNA